MICFGKLWIWFRKEEFFIVYWIRREASKLVWKQTTELSHLLTTILLNFPLLIRARLPPLLSKKRSKLDYRPDECKCNKSRIKLASKKQFNSNFLKKIIHRYIYSINDQLMLIYNGFRSLELSDWSLNCRDTAKPNGKCSHWEPPVTATQPILLREKGKNQKFSDSLKFPRVKFCARIFSYFTFSTFRKK